MTPTGISKYTVLRYSSNGLRRHFCCLIFKQEFSELHVTGNEKF